MRLYFALTQPVSRHVANPQLLTTLEKPPGFDLDEDDDHGGDFHFDCEEFYDPRNEDEKGKKSKTTSFQQHGPFSQALARIVCALASE